MEYELRGVTDGVFYDTGRGRGNAKRARNVRDTSYETNDDTVDEDQARSLGRALKVKFSP